MKKSMTIAQSVLIGQEYLIAYHVLADNNPIGQHQRVCTLMTGIFNNPPPKPRYICVWDIDAVLNYLSKLPDYLCLPIRVLSHKLALLLSLAAVSRVLEICYLNTKYMVESEVIFFKTS